MAATLEQLQARREALKKAIDSGVQVVRSGDSSVEYRSLKEMLDALAALDGEIAGFGTTKRVRSFRIHERGEW